MLKNPVIFLPVFSEKDQTHRKQNISSGFCRFLFISTLFFCLFSVVWAAPLQKVSYDGQQKVQEYELKAIYLYNFLQFVQWPDSQLSLSKDGSVVIGIVGESPFGEALEELQANVRKNGMKPVRIIHYGPYHEGLNLRNCNLLFVSSSEKHNFSAIIADVMNAPVLTVAETESFLSYGGMISLVKNNEKIRWIINRPAVEKTGLRCSVQLLSIAVKVLGEP